MTSLIDRAVSFGLSLEHRISGYVKVLDETGEDHRYRREEFMDLLRRQDNTTFQWWWGECYDACCGMRRISNCILMDFYISFGEELHTYRLLSCLEDVYKKSEQRGVALGLAFDSVGFTYPYPWVEILSSGEVELDGYPEKLILSKEAGRRLLERNPLIPEIIREEGDSLVLSQKEMLEWEEEMRQRPGPSPLDNLGEIEPHPGPRTLYGRLFS
jgi:hypothetical protein